MAQRNISGPTFPKIKESEWSDQFIYMNGVRIPGIKGNKYGVKVDKAHLFAEGDSNFGIQSGNREPTGMLKVLKSTMDAMMVSSIAAGGRDVCDVSFDIVTVYKAQGSRGMRRMTQAGVQISSFEYGWEQNAKEMIIELPYLYEDLLFS